MQGKNTACQHKHLTQLAVSQRGRGDDVDLFFRPQDLGTLQSLSQPWNPLCAKVMHEWMPANLSELKLYCKVV